ncbi:hypothetical protein Pyrfu_1709 [Pyrolobus fumarii 1A]|uniref:Radical SAM domain protein n=1 Tax=Pyrolobus fumarii (strain DSM 11204 / 1A) TaxID=694429 RepID=G0ECJ5_PYRF1|nr:hypothetical protein [Pyrolobus fumarii]AEM39565.1 hypothetical protein Pyrfu_1709 [Pyrolobus fumarii 1A]
MEEVPLYSVCPGCLAVRVVVPGGGFECDACWWNEYRDATSLAVKALTDKLLMDKLSITRAEIVVIDGPDPIEARADAIASILSSLGGSRIVRVVKTLGLIGHDKLEKVVKNVDAVIVELAVFAVKSKPREFTKVYETLEWLVKKNVHVELLFPYAVRGAKTILTDIVMRWKVPTTVLVVDENLYDEAYKTVDKLRSENHPVFLHEDTSYTLLDYKCPYCGEILVERRPWRVMRRYTPPNEPSRVTCPSCKREVALLDLAPVKRPRIKRRVVIY